VPFVLSRPAERGSVVTSLEAARAVELRARSGAAAFVIHAAASPLLTALR
jgi:hypothetical protein